MDPVDANEGRCRQLLGGSAEVITLQAEGWRQSIFQSDLIV